MSTVDVLIIGGGPAGYVAGIRAAQLDAKVTIVENEMIGGTCLNRGCVPTKILIERTKFLTKLGNIGMQRGDAKPQIKLRDLIETKRTVVERIVKSTRRLLESYGIEIIQGFGRIVGQKEVEISHGGTAERMAFKNLILATGSSPAGLHIPGGDSQAVLSGEKLLELDEAPSHLIIIGGGGIGIEFACIFNALGTEVTVLELMPHILPKEDQDMSQFLRQLLENRGIRIQTDANVKRVVSGVSGRSQVQFVSASHEETIEGDTILMSVGRVPNVQHLGLESVGVVTEKNWIKTDSHMHTSVPNIYAAGDVAGRYQLAYTAWAEGVVAAENIMGKNSEIDYSVVPRCTFSNPQLASVGLTESEVRSKGIDARIGVFSFSDNSRALALGEAEGGIKIISDAESGEILGAHILGPEAAELIGGIGLAMKLEATVEDLGKMTCIHPTLFEVIREAALDVHDRAIHRMKK